MAKYGIGQAITRREDEKLLYGKGKFLDDVTVEGEAHVWFLRSPHARAKILSIDYDEALKMEGVIEVITGNHLISNGVGPLPINAALKNSEGNPMAAPPNYPLAKDAVDYVGKAVVAVVADSREIAQNASEAIVIEYEELEAVVTVEEAMAEGAPQLWSDTPRNIAAQNEIGDALACEEALKASHHVTRIKINNQRLVPVSMEARGTIATYDSDSDRITIRTSCQNPAGLQATLAEAVLKIPKEKVRVLVGDVGGGFGMKTQLYPEDAVCAYAAKITKRAVHWRATRSEEFLAGNHGRDLLGDAKMGFDKSGKITAFSINNIGNIGAHASGPGAIIAVAVGPKVQTGVYHIPNFHLVAKAVLTNTNVVGAYRGAGRPEAIFLLERIMDQAAYELKMDPAELRRKNLLQPSQMPYTTPTGETFDCGNFPHMLDRMLEKSDWQGYQDRVRESASKGLLRGRAISTFLEWTGASFEETVEVHVGGDGRLKIMTALQAMGQGIETCLVQVLSDKLGVDADTIDFIQGDSDIGAYGIGSMGSRSLYIGGSAVMSASSEIIEKGKKFASKELEAAEEDIVYSDGKFTVIGTDISVDLFELAEQQDDGRIIVKTHETVGGPSWPNSCHVCEVEVDPQTGCTEVVKYLSGDDVGTVINPLIVAGQVHGGIAQAVGQALLENTKYDADTGQLLTGSLLDYCLPRADNLCEIETFTDESTPCKINPLGAKGVGELGTVGGTPTVLNAVLNAIREVGVTDIDMPATSEKVWIAIEEAKKKIAA
ncbi:MAG: carbon monoxide dehydrogenase [Proteobacteria bacterium]|nr:carbon monoxide dehydrogenase [Pseudomonadota bacterium]